MCLGEARVRIDIVTIFPEYLSPLGLSLLGRASIGGQVDYAVHDLREWTHDIHRTVDDTPYGGGPGMVMRPEPWGEALDHLLAEDFPDGRGAEDLRAEDTSADSTLVVVPTPAGEPFTQEMAHSFAARRRLVFACGRYEGIDQRVFDHVATRVPVSEVSLGDYVLLGGEVAVLVMVEAVVRLLPGVLGNAASLDEESHTDGLLEAPVYTKPAQWRGLDVPEVLRGGDHGRIARWRRDQSLLRTARRRPDLLTAIADRLDRADRAALTGGGFPDPRTDVAE
jgi:tRNA (guanine37-N1)-methyltransferase